MILRSKGGLNSPHEHENEFLRSGSSINEWKKRSRCKWIGRTLTLAGLNSIRISY